MPEFVNPKYADKEKTVFKKPTRLECMMQEYPKVLPRGAKVGFTTAEAWMCYSPAKNAASEAAALIRNGVPAGCASQAEADQFYYAAELLRQLGAAVDQEGKSWYLDIPVSLGPKIVFDPTFAVFPCEVKAHFKNPGDIRIRSRSSLVLAGESVFVEKMDLDGALKVVAKRNQKVTINAGYINNLGFETNYSTATKETNEIEAMRGYKFEKKEQEVVTGQKEAFVYKGPADGGSAPCLDMRDIIPSCDQPHLSCDCNVVC